MIQPLCTNLGVHPQRPSPLLLKFLQVLFHLFILLIACYIGISSHLGKRWTIIRTLERFWWPNRKTRVYNKNFCLLNHHSQSNRSILKDKQDRPLPPLPNSHRLRKQLNTFWLWLVPAPILEEVWVPSLWSCHVDSETKDLWLQEAFCNL